MRQENRQSDRTDVAVDSANIYMYMFPRHGCVCVCMRAARKLSVSDGILLDRLKLILAISDAGVNTG